MIFNWRGIFPIQIIMRLYLYSNLDVELCVKHCFRMFLVLYCARTLVTHLHSMHFSTQDTAQLSQLYEYVFLHSISCQRCF